MIGLSKLLQNDVWIFALKKTHRFEQFKYLYLRIMSISGHNNLTKLSEAHAINDTDYSTDISLQYWYSMNNINKASFFLYASCRIADKELVADSEKYESRCGCSCSFGCTFSRCALLQSGRRYVFPRRAKSNRYLTVFVPSAVGFLNKL